MDDIMILIRIYCSINFIIILIFLNNYALKPEKFCSSMRNLILERYQFQNWISNNSNPLCVSMRNLTLERLNYENTFTSNYNQLYLKTFKRYLFCKEIRLFIKTDDNVDKHDDTRKPSKVICFAKKYV